MAMRNRIITNYPYHEPNCDSISLESKLMFYTDIIIAGNLDTSEYDSNLRKIMKDVTPVEIGMAEIRQKDYFMKLYYQSEKDNYFWEYCPFQVYLNTFEYRKKQYFIGSRDSINRDFYIYELCELCDIEEGYIHKIHSPKFDFSNFYRYPKRIKIEGNSGATFVEYKRPFFKPIIEDTQKRKIEYILESLNKESQIFKIDKFETETIGTNLELQPENPYPRIFKDYKSSQLFKYLQTSVEERTQLADYSFIYWSMHRDKFIYDGVKPTEFMNWLNGTFHIAFSELKTYENSKKGKRNSNYQTAKLLFK